MEPVSIAAAIAAVVSVIANVVGGSKRKKELKKQQSLADIRAAENKAWYDKEYNTPYTESLEGKSALEYAREQMADENKKAAQAAAIVGGSNERAVAQKEATGKGMNSLTKNIAAQGAQHKNAERSLFMQGQAGNDALQSQLSAQRSQLYADNQEGWNTFLKQSEKVAGSMFGKQAEVGTGT